jgi:hypothetical protein
LELQACATIPALVVVGRKIPEKLILAVRGASWTGNLSHCGRRVRRYIWQEQDNSWLGL